MEEEYEEVRDMCLECEGFGSVPGHCATGDDQELEMCPECEGIGSFPFGHYS